MPRNRKYEDRKRKVRGQKIIGEKGLEEIKKQGKKKTALRMYRKHERGINKENKGSEENK